MNRERLKSLFQRGVDKSALFIFGKLLRNHWLASQIDPEATHLIEHYEVNRGFEKIVKESYGPGGPSEPEQK